MNATLSANKDNFPEKTEPDTLSAKQEQKRERDGHLKALKPLNC